MISFITDKWDEYLLQFNEVQKDIYYYEAYVKLYEDVENEALCAICIEDANIIMMPFIRKAINGFFDFETPYGYGGPIANTDNLTWINNAIYEMWKLFYRANYVCGFVRFNPLLNNINFSSKELNVFFDRNTIAISTFESEDLIWTNQISSKNRNMIRKAEKNGLIYKAEYDFASLDEFVNLYNLTMERLNADKFYFFDDNYHQQFKQNLINNGFLGTVRKDSKLVCGALFMYSDIYGHYHLEGSNPEFSSLGGNNLLLWKTTVEFKKLGIKEFHLGGGYNSDPNNSLFKFKKSFSDNTKKFYIGKWIFDNVKYNQLKEEWMKKNPDKVDEYGNRLLCYRY